MLEYITAACSVCLLLFGANLQSAVHKSGLLMQDCAARPSHSSSFSSPSPLHTYISIWFYDFFFFCGTGSYPITLLCRFPFSPNLLYSGSSVLHLVPFFSPPFPVPSVFLGFSFTLISTSSLSSHTSCLCSFFLIYLLPSLSPGSPSSPIFFRRLLLSPSHPSISPTSHPLHISLFSSPVSPPLPLLVLARRVSVSGHKPHTWLIDFWKQLADARPMYGPANPHSEDPEAH